MRFEATIILCRIQISLEGILVLQQGPNSFLSPTNNCYTLKIKVETITSACCTQDALHTLTKKVDNHTGGGSRTPQGARRLRSPTMESGLDDYWTQTTAFWDVIDAVVNAVPRTCKSVLSVPFYTANVCISKMKAYRLPTAPVPKSHGDKTCSYKHGLGCTLYVIATFQTLQLDQLFPGETSVRLTPHFH